MSEKALQSLTVRYEVLKPFKYQGKMLKKGDPFIPAGGKWDAQLIALGKHVGRIESAVPRRARRKGN